MGHEKLPVLGNNLRNELVKELAPYNPVIVSGLAHGIDIAAHKAALQYGLKTIAVFAHGLDKIYPSAHATIAKTIIANGCLLTDYLSGTVALRSAFCFTK